MFTFDQKKLEMDRGGPWYWQIRFHNGKYNKEGVKAYTLMEACKILGEDFADVKRVNFQTGRDAKPMTEETKEKLRAVTTMRKELGKGRRKKKRGKK